MVCFGVELLLHNKQSSWRKYNWRLYKLDELRHCSLLQHLLYNQVYGTEKLYIVYMNIRGTGRFRFTAYGLLGQLP